MIEIDHICLGVKNVYEGAHRLRAETGLGNYDGGWFPMSGLANRIVPLGDHTYIEVEAVVDAHMTADPSSTACWFHDQVSDGDVYIGWCARTGSLAELEAVAKRLNVELMTTMLKRTPDGGQIGAPRAPAAVTAWKAGVPNFFFFPDLARHGSQKPVTGPSPTVPRGLAWMEVGGTAEEMSDWLGQRADTLALKFNGDAPGLYAVAIKTDAGEVVIRRPNAVKLARERG
jgi:Glyoxalase-like domain